MAKRTLVSQAEHRKQCEHKTLQRVDAPGNFRHSFLHPSKVKTGYGPNSCKACLHCGAPELEARSAFSDLTLASPDFSAAHAPNLSDSIRTPTTAGSLSQPETEQLRYRVHVWSSCPSVALQGCPVQLAIMALMQRFAVVLHDFGTSDLIFWAHALDEPVQGLAVILVSSHLSDLCQCLSMFGVHLHPLHEVHGAPLAPGLPSGKSAALRSAMLHLSSFFPRASRSCFFSQSAEKVLALPVFGALATSAKCKGR